MDYFKNFPKINYTLNDRPVVLKNITIRTKIRDFIRDNITVYEPYVIKEWDKPEQLALSYYGNFKYTWLIYMANDILDPLNDWPKDYYNFQKYIEHKYGSIEAAYQQPYAYYNDKDQIIDGRTYANNAMADINGNSGSDYAVDDRLILSDSRGNLTLIKVLAVANDEIIRYEIEELGNPFNEMFTKPSYSGINTYSLTATQYTKSCYDYENELNESKRYIKLIKPGYASGILEEFRDLIKE